MLAVGEYLDPSFDPNLARLGTGWGGGIGERARLCGAIAAGVMLIGHRHGRVELHEDDRLAQRLSGEFLERFEAEAGFTECRDRTGGVFSAVTHRRCGRVVSLAAEILIDLLEPEGRRDDEH
jgi:C_GCAxxG_C_C family probable redox protein